MSLKSFLLKVCLLVALIHSGKMCTRSSEWGSRDEDQQDQRLWEDNWDDDNVEDDFSVQLR